MHSVTKQSSLQLAVVSCSNNHESKSMPTRGVALHSRGFDPRCNLNTGHQPNMSTFSCSSCLAHITRRFALGGPQTRRRRDRCTWGGMESSRKPRGYKKTGWSPGCDRVILAANAAGSSSNPGRYYIWSTRRSCDGSSGVFLWVSFSHKHKFTSTQATQAVWS